MRDDSLERILEFNRELTVLSSIGLPFDVETDPSETIARRLGRISSALEIRVSRGQSIQQAMADEPLVSLRYQSAAFAWLRCDDPTVALDGLAAGAVARRRLYAGFNQWIAYPLIVVTLTYAGLLVLCTFTVPRIEALLDSIGQMPTGVIGWLIEIRDWMPVWSVAVPLLALALFAWQRWRPRRQMPSDSSRKSGYFAAARHADMAERLTRLLESGVPEPESLALVTDRVDRREHIKSTLPSAEMEANIVRDESGTRIVVSLDWDRLGDPKPVSLVGWLDPISDSNPRAKVTSTGAQTQTDSDEVSS